MTNLEQAVIEAARAYCRTEMDVPKRGSIGPFRRAEQALKEAVAAYEEALLFSRTQG
jgi:hypothetical protein